jgi:hypothetical protein
MKIPKKELEEFMNTKKVKNPISQEIYGEKSYLKRYF